MLEILIVFRLCTAIGARRAKGLSGHGFQVMLVLFWIAGEFGAAIAAALVMFLVYGNRADEHFWLIYLAAIAGAALAAWAAFLIVGAVAPAHHDDEDDDYHRDDEDDDYHRDDEDKRGDRKRRKRRDYEDDDREDDRKREERSARDRDRDEYHDSDERYRR